MASKQVPTFCVSTIFLLLTPTHLCQTPCTIQTALKKKKKSHCKQAVLITVSLSLVSVMHRHCSP